MDWQCSAISQRRRDMALCRIFGLCVVIAATLGVTPHQAWCDPIRITDGNVVADQEEPFTACEISGLG
jgi:hypothetical protein